MSRAPEVQLPITPMLDMTFQLMFFFLTTFNPVSVREGQVALSLPARSAPQTRDQQQVDPKDETHRDESDDHAVVTVGVRGCKDPGNRGLISYLTISTDHAGDEEIKGTGEEREQALAERLERARPIESGKKRPTVRMEAGSDVQWSQVVRIVDVCSRTGYQVSFTRPGE